MARIRLNRATVEKIAKKVPYDALEKKVLSNKFHDPIRTRGYLERGEFLDIVRWKSPRQQPNACKNSQEEVQKFARQAFSLRFHPLDINI